ncbi:MAG TPA: DUF1801 domain-containing protein [Flavisolibacter sp.]|jgi:hypothetical protein|nr:DUF1801 domain-containing protein [Flavisolibacter sp.]
MNKLQNISFHSVEELLDTLPAEERLIVEQLREIIFTCLPHAKEKLSYNVPYYFLQSRVCFIWPASVPWGGIQKGVLIGFCKGHLLSDVSYLEIGKRKHVFTRTFYSIKEINRESLSQLIYEAAWIDEEEKKRKQ